MLIGIDHGNAYMKTANHTFVSGVQSHLSKPLMLSNDILFYNEKYYTLSNQRIPYQRHKRMDERFFILTLFGIAKELWNKADQKRNIEKEIELAVGLPPAHYSSQYQSFENYFMNKKKISYVYNDTHIHIVFKNVRAYPQAYAAVVPIYSQIKEIPKTVVIDIGGFTTDYLQIKYGNPELSLCGSLEKGIITLYNNIISTINAEYDILIEEEDINQILLKRQTIYEDTIIQYIHSYTQTYLSDLLNTFRELSIDLKTCQAVFAGGGAILLKPYILQTIKSRNPLFMDNVQANANGYEILYKASSGK